MVLERAVRAADPLAELGPREILFSSFATRVPFCEVAANSKRSTKFSPIRNRARPSLALCRRRAPFLGFSGHLDSLQGRSKRRPFRFFQSNGRGSFFLWCGVIFAPAQDEGRRASLVPRATLPQVVLCDLLDLFSLRPESGRPIPSRPAPPPRKCSIRSRLIPQVPHIDAGNAFLSLLYSRSLPPLTGVTCPANLLPS